MPKSKQPSSKSFKNVQEAVNDTFAIAKFHFFSFVGSIFKPFLTKYQTSSPMLPFMFDDITELVRGVLQLFIKPEVLNTCSSFKAIDLSKKDNFLSRKKLNIGRASDIAIAKIKQKDLAKLDEIDEFKSECRSFLIATTKKLLDKTPLNSGVVKNASCLKPSNLNKTSSQEKFKTLMNRLVYLNILSHSTGDKAFSQFQTLQISLGEEADKIASFNPNTQRLDEFYFHQLNNVSKHNELCTVLKLIFTLSHGQADVERGFSLNKNLINQNMESLTIISRRRVKDHLLSNKLLPHTFEVPTKLMQYAQSAHRNYVTYLETMKVQEGVEKVSKQREIIDQEIECIMEKTKIIDKTIKILDDGFVKFVETAEKETDISLVSKANAMKRKSSEKKKELEDLEEALNVLKEKRKKL